MARPMRGNLTITLIRCLDQILGGKVFWAKSFGQNSWVNFLENLCQPGLILSANYAVQQQRFQLCDKTSLRTPVSVLLLAYISKEIAKEIAEE